MCLPLKTVDRVSHVGGEAATQTSRATPLWDSYFENTSVQYAQIQASEHSHCSRTTGRDSTLLLSAALIIQHKDRVLIKKSDCK